MKQIKIKSVAKESAEDNTNELTITVDAKRTIADIEGLLTAIVQSSEDAIISKTLEGIVTSWNPAAEKLFGYTSTEMIGLPITKIIPKDRLDEEPEIIKKIKAGEIIAHFETQRVSKEGKLIDISLTISPVKDTKGNIIGASKIARDITHQVEARRRIQENEILNRTILESSPDCVKVIDSGGRIQFMNTNGLCAMEIDDFDTVKDKPWTELWGKENKHLVEEAITKSLQGEIATFQAFCPTAKGTPKWWDVNLSSIKEMASGKVLSLISVSRDITANKKIEKALKESDERLRLATQTSGVGIWEWNLITNKVRWDAQMFHIYGVEPTADGFIEYETWSNAVVPEDLAEQERILQDTVKNIGSSKRSFKIYRANDHVPRYIEAIEIVRTKANGEAEWVVGTNIDITGRKELIEQLDATVNQLRLYENVIINSHDAILITEAEPFELPGPRIVYANEAFYKLTGYTPEETIGETPRILQGPKTDRNQLDKIKAALRKKESVKVELINYTKEGKEFYVEFEIVPVADEKGLVTHFVSVQRDVTERKIAEEKINKLATHLDLSTTSADVGVWLLDINSEKLEWSAQHKRMWGYKETRTDLGYEDWHEVIHPEDKERCFAEVEAAMNEKRKYEVDYRIHRANDGVQRWVKSVGQYQYNDNGQAVTLTGISIDITDAKIAVEKIKDSEKRYNLMLMQSPFAFLILKGKDMVVHLANESMKEVLGKGADIEGKPLLEVIPEIKGQAFPDLLDNVYNTGIPFAANEMLAQLTRNGKLEDVYFNYVYQPYFEADNTILGVTVIAYDVTATVLSNNKIKESEERFRSLTQTLPQLIWVTDAQGNAEFASFRWKEYTGIELGGEKAWRQIVHPDDYDNINAGWIHSLTKGNNYTFDVRLKSKSGEYRWHTVKGEPVLDKENKIVKWVGAFTDIHEHKIREEKKDEFISIASHEMKTPLTIAKAYLQMLEISLDESNEDANLYAKKASQSVNRLNELISELLDVSKIRLGKLNYTVTTFNFNDMIESTVENIQLTSPKHTIIKTGKVNNELTGDKERLQQVVINLLTNSIKYSPGEDKVFITVEQIKDMIKVSVKDTGIGIAQQSLDKIFEKYHRVEEHAVHFQGLGIGLFISYEIIQRHHGKLWAESEVGKGSTFYFTIPLHSVSIK
ncbi:MAG: PAS domain S-box protein [Chitinophagales bacterium]